MFKRIPRVMWPFALVGVFMFSGAAIAAEKGPIATSGDTASLLKEAVAGSWRSAAHKARNKYRHPVQTLEFFGIESSMTVIELSPGGGWYTEILAPFLYAHGHLIEAVAPLDSESKFMAKLAHAYSVKLAADPAVYGHIEKVIPFAPPAQVSLGPDNSADMVLTFRNSHDWMNINPETLTEVFKAVFAVLKPDGVFGVVEHRAKPYALAAVSAGKLHRLPEDYLIELGLKTGFRLAGVSEINANPKDPGDINVHSLLPDLAWGDSAAQKKRYKEIGESDRMTLKFVKPSVVRHN